MLEAPLCIGVLILLLMYITSKGEKPGAGIPNINKTKSGGAKNIDKYNQIKTKYDGETIDIPDEVAKEVIQDIKDELKELNSDYVDSDPYEKGICFSVGQDPRRDLEHLVVVILTEKIALMYPRDGYIIMIISASYVVVRECSYQNPANFIRNIRKN